MWTEAIIGDLTSCYGGLKSGPGTMNGYNRRYSIYCSQILNISCIFCAEMFLRKGFN